MSNKTQLYKCHICIQLPQFSGCIVIIDFISLPFYNHFICNIIYCVVLDILICSLQFLACSYCDVAQAQELQYVMSSDSLHIGDRGIIKLNNLVRAYFYQ